MTLRSFAAIAAVAAGLLPAVPAAANDCRHLPWSPVLASCSDGRACDALVNICAGSTSCTGVVNVCAPLPTSA